MVIYDRNSSTPLEALRQTIIFFLNEQKKAFDVPQVQLLDPQNLTEIKLETFYEAPLARAILNLPTKSEIVTVLPANENDESHRAEGWTQYDLLQPDKIALIKHKKNQQIEKVSYSTKVLEKLNKHFEEAYQEYLEANQKFQKLSVEAPKILLNSQEIPQNNEKEQLSPKFGQAKDDSDYDLKKRQKVGGGDGKSQAQFLKQAQQQQPVQLRPITPEEVAAHNTEADCWTVHNGLVYDVTNYLKFHPGGIAKLMLGAGKDCSALVCKEMDR